jgi:hypothetical protein
MQKRELHCRHQLKMECRVKRHCGPGHCSVLAVLNLAPGAVPLASLILHSRQTN